MCEFVRRVSVFRLPMEHQCTATYANARGKRLRVELGGEGIYSPYSQFGPYRSFSQTQSLKMKNVEQQ